MALQKFEKLKIDTDSLAATPKSGLSDLAHEDHSHNGSISRSDHDYFPKVPDQDFLQSELLADEGELADREDNDGIQERDFGGPGSSLGTVSQLSSLEASLRNRGTAISFDSQVTLEGGYRHLMQQPLPRSESWTGPNFALLSPQNHEPHHHRVHSDTETSRYDSDTGKPLDRRKERPRIYYRKGEPRHPLLQSTVDDLAKDPFLEDPDRIASLTSATTASPIQEEVQTPLNNYLVSPVAESPLEFSPERSSSAWPTKRSESQSRRSMRSTPNSVGSARGRTRRSSSRRSGTSTNSGSVGENYLHKFFGRSTPKPPQEDDEGQEIGDHSQYIIGKQIGKGGFSVIKEAVTIKDGEKVTRAVKIIRKQLPTSDEAENERIQLALEQEVKLWSTLNYKYILPLIEAHTTPFATYCITQLNRGGTLFDLMHSRQKLAEPGIDAYLAKRYIYQLGCAIRYLHEDMRIVHRDIKLDNCLLDMSDPRASVDGGNVLLCDFGMAEYIRTDDRNSPSTPPDDQEHNIGPGATSTNVTGTPEYASPEVVNATKTVISTATDLWSYGVCMYVLITGKYPFRDSFQPRLIILITRGTWGHQLLLNSPAVRRDGAKVANLVRGCLEPDADARYTIRQALDEDWFEGCGDLYDADEPLAVWSS